jgi:hypothetical protein
MVKSGVIIPMVVVLYFAAIIWSAIRSLSFPLLLCCFGNGMNGGMGPSKRTIYKDKQTEQYVKTE